jgi:hypothetical protein
VTVTDGTPKDESLQQWGLFLFSANTLRMLNQNGATTHL